MRRVAWWGAISAVAAPVVLIGGWTVAAGRQQRFDPVADTVSALAAIGATDRWVMNLVFVLVGACYILTALALRPAKTAGRLILICGAIAGMLVAANPEHAGGFGSVPHFVFASLGFAACLVIDRPVTLLVGFAFLGAGLGSVVPMILRAAGAVDNVDTGRAVAAVAGCGWAGFVVGPVVIGELASTTTLHIALFLIPVLAGAVAVATGTAKALRRSAPSAHTSEPAIRALPTEP